MKFLDFELCIFSHEVRKHMRKACSRTEHFQISFLFSTFVVMLQMIKRCRIQAALERIISWWIYSNEIVLIAHVNLNGRSGHKGGSFVREIQITDRHCKSGRLPILVGCVQKGSVILFNHCNEKSLNQDFQE